MPQPELFTHQSGGVFHFDDAFFNSVRMAMAQLRRSSDEELNTYLGGAHLFSGGMEEALLVRDRVAMISSNCNDMQVEEIVISIQSLGYLLIKRERFQGEGRVVMEGLGSRQVDL